MLLGDDGWFIMKVLLLLVLLTVSGCESIRVVGQTGQNVTLNCRYDIKKEGASHACWNKGQIPNWGRCNNKLISTDGYKVIKETRVSSRYQLLGRLDEGDVSLTILNLTEEDAGLYGCRVEIPGWNNYQKHHFVLFVEKAPDLTTSPPSDKKMLTERQDVAKTTDLMTTDTLLTYHSTNSIRAKILSASCVWPQAAHMDTDVDNVVFQNLEKEAHFLYPVANNRGEVGLKLDIQAPGGQRDLANG
ncbi:hepatitis A virus cellular receptor 1 homolog [Cyprinodon tularosa]|uniref:hepatitis A virus cellular receptor 1 homolog n=1 Tax=Cyprinodon tularosa TaxID=77115 RepID=UPI0018E243EF|nr:hepatitis A virus cellular receptor 1 homolog [Cyprinodon tularosa]